MSWQGYIDNLKMNNCVADAAIVGCQAGAEGVWASSPGLQHITPEEIKKLTKERSKMFCEGLSVGGVKCTMIRDQMDDDATHTMDIKTKATSTDCNTYNMSIGMSKTALVIVKGKEGNHGGTMNKCAYDMSEYLRKSDL